MAILQPEVPHYRTEFFQKLANNMKKLDIFIFNPLSSTKQSGFKVDFENLIYIANKKIRHFGIDATFCTSDNVAIATD